MVATTPPSVRGREFARGQVPNYGMDPKLTNLLFTTSPVAELQQNSLTFGQTSAECRLKGGGPAGHRGFGEGVRIIQDSAQLPTSDVAKGLVFSTCGKCME